MAQALLEVAGEDFDAAAHSFERALDALTASSMEREAAAVCREWSELLVAAGRSEEAASIASRRVGLARATGAKP